MYAVFKPITLKAAKKRAEMEEKIAREKAKAEAKAASASATKETAAAAAAETSAPEVIAVSEVFPEEPGPDGATDLDGATDFGIAI